MNSDELPLFRRAVPAETAPKSPPVGHSGESAQLGRGAQSPASISVSDLNRRVRGLLEAKLELIWVNGELSNVLRAASGHWYFVLKDDAAQVRCVMFRQRAQALAFKPENGLQVEVRALPSLYEPRGEFQLGVENMRRAGQGNLFEAFERLKAKLAAEGLFAPDRKRTLPTFARTLAIITSPQAAALRDVLTAIRRRAPFINVVIYPTAVQGASAPAEICAAITAVSKRVAVDHPDALLICRGGGSAEDLWSFNDEAVARAIVAFQATTHIPVVSAVGHETDFTIADFVADLRAPTPTAGAELLTPDISQLRVDLASLRGSLSRAQSRLLAQCQQRIDFAARGLLAPGARLQLEASKLLRLRSRLQAALSTTQQQALLRCEQLRGRLLVHSPQQRLDREDRKLHDLHASLGRAIKGHLQSARRRVEAGEQALNFLNPHQVLARGYAIVTKVDGSIVRQAANLAPTDALRIRVAEGELDATVTSVSARDA